MKLLKQYIIALTNLYGMVHKEMVVEIYNEQNEEQIISNDLNSYFKVVDEELEDAFVLCYKNYFVHETIMEFDEFDIMLNKKNNKPYYIPKKNELLNYTDEWYFEKTTQYKILLKYITENFFKGDIEAAEELCEDIQGLCQFDFKMQSIFNEFNNKGISFNDIDHANEVLQMVIDFSNNIRIWDNNGFTPHEIFEKIEKPNLKPLPSKPFIINKDKIGRNDICPCGSGKKYKKCCMD